MKKANLIEEIIKRADNLGLLNFVAKEIIISRLKTAFKCMNIDINILYNLNDSNFSHDIIGLINNFDLVTKTCFNFSLKSKK